MEINSHVKLPCLTLNYQPSVYSFLRWLRFPRSFVCARTYFSMRSFYVLPSIWTESNVICFFCCCYSQHSNVHETKLSNLISPHYLRFQLECFIHFGAFKCPVVINKLTILRYGARYDLEFPCHCRCHALSLPARYQFWIHKTLINRYWTISCRKTYHSLSKYFFYTFCIIFHLVLWRKTKTIISPLNIRIQRCYNTTKNKILFISFWSRQIINYNMLWTVRCVAIYDASLYWPTSDRNELHSMFYEKKKQNNAKQWHFRAHVWARSHFSGVVRLCSGLQRLIKSGCNSHISSNNDLFFGFAFFFLLFYSFFCFSASVKVCARIILR